MIDRHGETSWHSTAVPPARRARLPQRHARFARRVPYAQLKQRWRGSGLDAQLGPTQPEAQRRLDLALPSAQREPRTAGLDLAGLTLSHVHVRDLDDASFPDPAVARISHHRFFSLAAGEHPRHREKDHGSHEPGRYDSNTGTVIPTETPAAAFPYADPATPPASRTALAQ